MDGSSPKEKGEMPFGEFGVRFPCLLKESGKEEG